MISFFGDTHFRQAEMQAARTLEDEAVSFYGILSGT
jgi:hypothetical protein